MRKVFGFFVVLLLAVSVQAVGITDNFDDQLIANGPDTGAPPASWSGAIDTDPGWNADATGAWGALAGSAACDDAGARMDLSFGATYSEIVVDFNLMQPNGTPGAFRMEMGFVTDAGAPFKLMESSPQLYRWGAPHNTSFTSYDGGHNIVGRGTGTDSGRLAVGGWQHIRFVFDVDEYETVKVYAEDYDSPLYDPDKGYDEANMIYVAYMENWHPSSGNDAATGATGFAWSNRDGVVTWQVDDVAVTPEPATMMLLGVGALATLKRRTR